MLNTLSGPKMGSPNLRAIRDLGPVYFAIAYNFTGLQTDYTLLLLGGRQPL